MRAPILIGIYRPITTPAVDEHREKWAMTSILDQRDGEDRRHEVNGGPWWVKSIYVVGPITVIALGLVYLLAVDVRNEARAAAAVSNAIQQDLREHQAHTEALHRNIEDYMRVQNLLTRQLCVNASKTIEERRACFQP